MTRLMNDDIPGLAGERDARPGRGRSDVLHKFWIEEGESGKLVLVEVHHEELVGGRQLRLLGGELAVKVGDVFPVALQERGGTRYCSYVARSIVFRATRSLHLARRLYRSSGRSLLHVSLVSVSRDLSTSSELSHSNWKKNYVSCTNRDALKGGRRNAHSDSDVSEMAMQFEGRQADARSKGCNI